MSSRSPVVVRFLAAAAVAILAVQPAGQATSPAAVLPAAKSHPRRSLKALAFELVERLGTDNTTLVAAGVAFYAFLAVFPAVAALVAVFGLVADPHIVEAQVAELTGILPQSALNLILGVVKSVAEKPRGQLGVTFAVSVVIALWSARAGVTSLMSGLDIAYRNRSLRSFVAATVIGLGLTLGSILVAAALIATIAGLPAFYAAAPATFMRWSGPFLAWARWPAIGFLMAVSVAVLYRIAPSKPLPSWHVFSAGTLLATVLWLASSSAFSLYVTWSGSYDATYGSLAGAVVLMLWLWASSVSILFGATVDSVLAGKPV